MSWFFVLASVAWAGIVDRAAAVVDDEVVALSEIYEIGGDYIDSRCGVGSLADTKCVYDMELEVLDVLIKRLLVRAELVRLEMRVSGEELDQAIDRYARASGFEDRTELRKAIEEGGTRWETFRDEMQEQIRTQRFQQRVLLPRVTVTDDEVKDMYQRTERKTRVPEVVLDALGIPVPADTGLEGLEEAVARAQSVVQAVNAGELEWEQAVAEHDAAGLAAAVGGRRYREGELAEKLESVVFGAEVGVVSPPVRIGDVLFVVVVREKGMGDGGVAPLEEVADALRDQLFQEKIGEAEDEWYQITRRQSAVQVLLERP